MNLDDAINTIIAVEESTVEALELDVIKKEVAEIREFSDDLEREKDTQEVSQ